LWARSGVAPRAPAVMARWADRLEAMLQRRARLAARSASAAELGRRVEEAEVALRQWFEALGLAAPTGFEIALREARDEVAARQRAWDGARKAADARASAARAVAEAEAGVAQRERELADGLAGWPHAMRGLRLAEAATPPEAEAALAAWAGVPLPRQTVTRETRSIEGIERDLSDFARAVGEIVTAVAPELTDLPAEAALNRLIAGLGKQRSAAARKAQLEGFAEKRQARRRREEAQRHALAPALAAAATISASRARRSWRSRSNAARPDEPARPSAQKPGASSPIPAMASTKRNCAPSRRARSGRARRRDPARPRAPDRAGRGDVGRRPRGPRRRVRLRGAGAWPRRGERGARAHGARGDLLDIAERWRSGRARRSSPNALSSATAPPRRTR